MTDQPLDDGVATPWLSLLLPVHAVGAHLDACLTSLVAQALPGIEIVCVDDASPGDDAERLARWEAAQPGLVRVLRHPHNRGLSAARNTLLDAARGRYVWFVDSDDLVEPGAIASLAAIVRAHAPDLVLCDFRTFRDADVQPGEWPVSDKRHAHIASFDGPALVRSEDRDALVAGLFRTGRLHAWSKVVRREAWPAGLRFPEGHTFEDLAVYPRLALAVRSFWYVPEVWIAYRQREGSILSTLSEQKLDDWTNAMVGLPVTLRDAGVRLAPETLFEVAHFAARTLLRAARHWRALCTHAYAGERLQAYVVRWRASSPLTEGELRTAYLRRGRLGRWAQFAWTLARAGR